jgi:hypothetical protein
VKGTHIQIIMNGTRIKVCEGDAYSDNNEWDACSDNNEWDACSDRHRGRWIHVERGVFFIIIKIICSKQKIIFHNNKDHLQQTESVISKVTKFTHCNVY